MVNPENKVYRLGERSLFLATCTVPSKLMSQTAYALLIFICVTLTGYFGLAALGVVERGSCHDRHHFP
jgi:hypothetical protein